MSTFCYCASGRAFRNQTSSSSCQQQPFPCGSSCAGYACAWTKTKFDAWVNVDASGGSFLSLLFLTATKKRSLSGTLSVDPSEVPHMIPTWRKRYDRLVFLTIGSPHGLGGTWSFNIFVRQRASRAWAVRPGNPEPPRLNCLWRLM